MSLENTMSMGVLMVTSSAAGRSNHEGAPGGFGRESRPDGTSAHGKKKRVRPHTTHEADCSSPARRFSGACCFLAFVSFLVVWGARFHPECAPGPSPAVL